MTWRKESYGVYNLGVSKTDVITNHFFLHSNCIILLDNTNARETIYITKKFVDNKYTRKFNYFKNMRKEIVS